MYFPISDDVSHHAIPFSACLLLATSNFYQRSILYASYFSESPLRLEAFYHYHTPLSYGSAQERDRMKVLLLK